MKGRVGGEDRGQLQLARGEARRADLGQRREASSREEFLDEQARNLVDKLDGYFKWAKSDERVAGFNPWRKQRPTFCGISLLRPLTRGCHVHRF